MASASWAWVYRLWARLMRPFTSLGQLTAATTAATTSAAIGLRDLRFPEHLAERLVQRLGEGDPGLGGEDDPLELGEGGDRGAEVDRLHVQDRVAHGQDQEIAAHDVRAGLAPQRELGADRASPG